jgi:serine phosphatase RsbU (regulator of sigma subunit)
MNHTLKTILIIIFLLLISTPDSAQSFLSNSAAAADHHHTPWEILSGSGDESLVCYKQAHRNMYLMVTGLIILIALIAIKLLQTNRKNNKILKSQNEIIAEKNKSITDSINYAKRLQTAILPPKEFVQNILPENFIIYQPKDIVSGDFYWVSHHGNKIIAAAIDCTGHGVPGALLSIVGHNAINQTVNELGILQPSKVLDSMNTIIKKILHQDKGSDIRDGMDMALCTFDKETNMLEYAGANNPVFIFSQGKLNIIKGSKLTVGSLEEDKVEPPLNHSIQLQKGDCFYIFSDGFVDQFGGKDNKKFKTSRFQELLISINNQSMVEQEKSICKTFKDWKGNYEQVDDVLIIGIRV